MIELLIDGVIFGIYEKVFVGNFLVIDDDW